MPKGESWKLREKTVSGRAVGEVIRARWSWCRAAVRDCGGGEHETDGFGSGVRVWVGRSAGAYIQHLGGEIGASLGVDDVELSILYPALQRTRVARLLQSEGSFGHGIVDLFC